MNKLENVILANKLTQTSIVFSLQDSALVTDQALLILQQPLPQLHVITDSQVILDTLTSSQL